MDSKKKVLDVTGDDLKVIEIAEVNKHSEEGDLWLVLDDLVYDVSEYDHPGGMDVFKDYFGGKGDAMEEFEEQGHSKTAYKQLDKLRIGKLNGSVKGQKKMVVKDTGSDMMMKVIMAVVALGVLVFIAK